MNITVKKDFEFVKTQLALHDAALWTFAHTEWHKLISPYTPRQTGTLMETVRIDNKGITYLSPYAHRMYEGESFNFRTDQNPLACAHWDQKAAPTQLPRLASAIQKYIDSGRVNLEPK